MALNLAQTINRTMTGCPDHPDADPLLAARQTAEYARMRYLALHANRGTPSKLHYTRKSRKTAKYQPGKRFTGHRI